jgi:hypothetical protein
LVIEGRIADGDVTLFDHIALTQSEPDDRKALLAIHDAVARRGPFTYLEIGSYLGGSLQAVVADPRCKHIISIDPRPEAPPDERGGYRSSLAAAGPLRGRRRRASHEHAGAAAA